MCRFLLVSLNMGIILGEVTIGLRKRKLDKMTHGNSLGDVYTTILTRLKAQKAYSSVLGMKVLMWVLYSKRPLRAEELCHALGVEIGSPDLDPENVPTVQTLVASCLGLVTLEASSSTVRLVHFTLQEYLSSDPTLFYTPHSTIAEVCLTYLNFECVRDLSPALCTAPPTLPLLEYASCYWGEHAGRGMTENVKILALRLLDRFDEHISAQLLLLHHNQDTGTKHIQTLLLWAAGSGHEGVVKMLLERKYVNPNPVDSSRRTPLSWAAGNGHIGVVKTLLERMGVDPDPADSSGRTPLSWAAGSGHGGIVKMLLERDDVNPDRADTQDGQTPLSWAARNGNESIVKTLLQRKGVDPDPADSSGRTPLSWATGSGHEGVLKTLLGRKDINLNPVDSSGRTLLSWAAGNGQQGVVKILLERKGVDPDLADSSGRTPLSWAAGSGHEGALKTLLARKDVDPDLADSSGRTPLLWAASRKHERVVELFLERRYSVPDPIPPVSLRIAIDVCFLTAALLFLSHLLTSA